MTCFRPSVESLIKESSNEHFFAFQSKVRLNNKLRFNSFKFSFDFRNFRPDVGSIGDETFDLISKDGKI